MDQSLTITIPLEEPTPEGLPTGAEAAALNALEDELTEELGHDAVYIGRETGQERRVLYFHAATMGQAEPRAREWARRHPERSVTIEAVYDPRWDVLRRW
jgi:hypothetical protein